MGLLKNLKIVKEAREITISQILKEAERLRDLELPWRRETWKVGLDKGGKMG